MKFVLTLAFTLFLTKTSYAVTYQCADQLETINALNDMFLDSCKIGNKEYFNGSNGNEFLAIAYEVKNGQCKLIELTGGDSDGETLDQSWFEGCEQ